jgi:hypothetical protein
VLSSHYQVTVDMVQVHRYHAEAFLLVLQSRDEADRVVHANPPEEADLWPIFKHWR